MNRRTMIIVGVCVFIAHVVAFYWLSHMEGARIKPKRVQPPNFGVAQETYTDSSTGEKVTYREFRVSTQLVDPAIIDKIKQERAAKAKAEQQTTEASPETESSTTQ